MDTIVSCPHCGEFVLIQELNCGIFRHAILKTTGQQIDPHSSKDVCEDYAKKGLIYGCGKPFQIIRINAKWEIRICDYI